MTLAQLLCLKDEDAVVVRVGQQLSPVVDPLVPTKFITTQFLRNDVEAIPERRLVLGRGCFLSQKQSKTLASYPDPLNVGIECMFEDCRRTFVETLLQRTTNLLLCTLASHRRCSDRNHYDDFSLKVFPKVMSTVSQISQHTSTHTLKSSTLLLPFSATAQRVEYINLHKSIVESCESPTILPKTVTMVFITLPARLLTRFLQASGILRELGLMYCKLDPPSAKQHVELLKTIAANDSLYRVDLGCLSFLEDLWLPLLQILQSHPGLRNVVFYVDHWTDLLHQVKDLK